ncbi:MAG: hypothetical protein NVS2B4_15850 [Ramlibacter sp.]
MGAAQEDTRKSPGVPENAEVRGWIGGVGAGLDTLVRGQELTGTAILGWS